jgi:hypothetical protein
MSVVMSLNVGDGPERTGRSMGLFSRIHWRVDFGTDIFDATGVIENRSVTLSSDLFWIFWS